MIDIVFTESFLTPHIFLPHVEAFFVEHIIIN